MPTFTATRFKPRFYLLHYRLKMLNFVSRDKQKIWRITVKLEKRRIPIFSRKQRTGSCIPRQLLQPISTTFWIFTSQGTRYHHYRNEKKVLTPSLISLTYLMATLVSLNICIIAEKQPSRKFLEKPMITTSLLNLKSACTRKTLSKRYNFTDTPNVSPLHLLDHFFWHDS